MCRWPMWAKLPAIGAFKSRQRARRRPIGSSTCRSASSKKRGRSRCGGEARLALLLHESLAVELDLSGDEVARCLSKATRIERLDRPRGIEGEGRLAVAPCEVSRLTR